MAYGRIERVAEALHDGWWAFSIANGWTLGPRDRATKTHPHLLPREALSVENNNQDRTIAVLLIDRLTDVTDAPPDEALAGMIHDAWADALRIDGCQHPHRQCAWSEHDESQREEHLTAARYVKNALANLWKGAE